MLKCQGSNCSRNIQHHAALIETCILIIFCSQEDFGSSGIISLMVLTNFASPHDQQVGFGHVKFVERPNTKERGRSSHMATLQLRTRQFCLL